MMISKAGRALGGQTPDRDEMDLIRGYAKGALEPADVYVFSVILCDNDIDRDFECFDDETLGELAALFPGKTGISDHEWRSGNQIARIYRTELQRDPARKTADGRPYACLRAWAYMLRSEANAALIADIEGGIKKEVSVGCSVARSYCSICGESAGNCSHVKGRSYDGKLCYITLAGAADAYEWSFVAVPAQRAAGVTKALDPAGDAEARLQREAALGRQYLGAARAETKRLALLCGKDLHDALSPALEGMEPEKLLELKAALEKRVAKKLPLRSQFPAAGEPADFDGRAYQV